MSNPNPAPTTKHVPASRIRLKGLPFSPKWQSYLTFCLMYILTLLVVSVTIAFAFLSFSLHLFDIFPSPQQTISALNVASSASVFLVGEALTSACEILRWTLAADSTVLEMASFLALGRATGLLGAVMAIDPNDPSRGVRSDRSSRAGGQARLRSVA